MRCQRAQSKLMAYHDGELRASLKRRIERHLASCRECSRLLEKLETADRHAGDMVHIRDVSGVPGVPPPDDKYWDSFTARVLDRVEEDAATRAPVTEPPRRRWDQYLPRLAPAFSIALVVVVAAGVLMKIGGQEPPRGPAVPVVDRAPPPGSDAQDEISSAAGEAEGTIADDEPAAEMMAPTAEPAEEAPAFKSAAPARADEEPVEQEMALAAEEAERTVVVRGSDLPEAPPPAERQEERTVVRGEPLREEPEPGPPAETEPLVPETPTVAVRQEPAALPASGLPGPEQTGTEAASETAGGDLQQETVPVPSPGPAVEEGTPSGAEAVRGTADGDPAAQAAREAPDKEAQPEEIEQTAAPPTVGRAASQPPAPAAEGITTGIAPREPAGNTGSSQALLYRGPEEQLTHARNLAEVRKFWESEQVLRDLISRNPALPIREEAAILLVEVVGNQNRVREAQQLLDEARERFPESEKVQNYVIGQ